MNLLDNLSWVLSIYDTVSLPDVPADVPLTGKMASMSVASVPPVSPIDQSR